MNIDNINCNVNNKININNYVYPYDFDYNFYKSLYLPDKNYTKEEIIFDFINNGYFNFKYGCMKEYCDYNYILPQNTKNIEINDIIKKSSKEPELKVISNNWNTNLNTCIIIHAFSIITFKEIMNHINNTNLKTFCNIIIVSPTKDIITYIKDEMKDVKMTLLYIKNKGMDTYGKLIAFKYILDNNLRFEWFLYLHTKTNSNWFNDLITPLLNKKVIDDIYKNSIDKNVYMIGSEECKSILKVSDEKYTSINLVLNKAGYKVKVGTTTTSIANINDIYAYWKLNIDLKYYINTYKEAYEHYQNNNEVRITINDYINDDNSKHIYYVAGTMYWSRINLIHYYKNMLTFLLSTMNISNRIVYSEYKISTVHLSELLDGILIQLNNKKILFINDNNNSDILHTYNFNYIFYKLNNPDIPYTSKNNLVDHYLKYGIHENRYASLNFYIYNHIYQNTNYNIFKNLGYISNNYKYISYKGNDNYYYKSDKDIYCINNIYTNLNTLIKHDVYKASNRKYILIITFSIGGGCSEFLNKLINYYIFNKIVNIIIIKYNSNKNGYTINYNNLLINKTFNFEMITKFINRINIKHIFVNTFYTFPKNFKDFIYSLNIKKYTVTHDFYNFFELPNPVYPHLKYKELYKNEINNFDVILTQNIYNIDVMNYICPIKKEIHLIDFPDYCSNLPFINHSFNNLLRNILIIGAIDYKKGSLLINDIFNKYNYNYNFFIAGKHDNKNINQQEYKSINEFNNILKLFKPSVILFTSLCPETYSYTLSLAMLTELPIIYYDIGDCVVSKRLDEYKFNSYKLCNIDNFATIIDNIFMNAHIKLGTYKLIDNKISVSTYWDNIFMDTNDAFNSYNYENIVLITSKIYVSNNKFSYTEKRSIYTKEERYVQTINTINSIKKYIPNVFIVLIDNSAFTENEKDVLINNTNIFINYNDKILDYYTNNNEIKAIAELCQLKYALNVINNYNIKFNNFFKITGRYIINNNFLYDIYAKNYKNDNIFKKNKLIKDRLYYYTCFYKISQNNFNDYVNKIYELYNELVLKSYENIYNVIDLEFLLPSQLQFKEINDLGITQFISCFNEISDI
jgi:hypothetical protein